MAKPHERILALLLAILFFGTSVAAGAAVFWQIRQDNKAKGEQSALEQTLQDSLNQSQKKEGTLEGTKLANFTPVEKVDQLQIQEITEGTGEVVKPGATITAHYTGALAKDGTIFQSSLDTGEPATFPLSGVIKGWTDGVPGMKVGGKRRLIIPAAQAYGDQSPSPNIPAGSDLVFDIELVKIDQQGQ
jgi:FKBP-type peptidyl-prolyl cis-trans isomerase